MKSYVNWFSEQTEIVIGSAYVLANSSSSRRSAKAAKKRLPIGFRLSAKPRRKTR